MADRPQPQTPPRQIEPATRPPVLSLTEAAHLDPTQARALLGTKAASLAHLAGAGFPVAPGVVVTAAAADWDQAQAQLRSAAAELDGGRGQRFAVRSSAAAEDLADASFAGQYETILDVGLDELPQAVRRVVDSAASARVAAYRQARPQAASANSFGSGAGMAVLVQVMVPAEAAGVAFTANPLTGDRDEVVIGAVRGLGERLVAGQATGDQWVVRDGHARRTRSTEEAISADQARQVATLGRRVQAHLGGPQDLEWAIATDLTATEGVVAAAGPADDGPARPGGLDPAHPRLLDAQPAPGRVAARAHDPAVCRLAAGTPRPRRAAGHPRPRRRGARVPACRHQRLVLPGHPSAVAPHHRHHAPAGPRPAAAVPARCGAGSWPRPGRRRPEAAGTAD